MPIKKRSEPPSGKTVTSPELALPVVSGRKPWKKKTPVEVVLEQADKLRQEIAEGEADLERKRKQLQKFEEARKIFEAI